MKGPVKDGDVQLPCGCVYEPSDSYVQLIAEMEGVDTRELYERWLANHTEHTPIEITTFDDSAAGRETYICRDCPARWTVVHDLQG